MNKKIFYLSITIITTAIFFGSAGNSNAETCANCATQRTNCIADCMSQIGAGQGGDTTICNNNCNPSYDTCYNGCTAAAPITSPTLGGSTTPTTTSTPTTISLKLKINTNATTNN